MRRSQQQRRIEQAETLAGEGWQLWQQQKFADAAGKFEKAVELDPDCGQRLERPRLGPLQQRRQRRRRPRLRKVRRAGAEPSGRAQRPGAGLSELARIRQAKKFLTKAAPQAPAAWFGLARFYLLTGKYEEAEKWIDKARRHAAE